MTNQEAIVYLEGQFDCMCSEDCQIYTGHKDCPQGFICTDGQALLTAISALQAQELSKNSPKLDKENGDLQPTCNKLSTDLINRQAAIEALDVLCDRECEYSKKQRSVMCGACHLGSAFDVVEQLPSAQPDTKAQLPGEGTTFDLISRRVAVDALMDFDKKLRKINWYQYPHTEYECRGVDEAIVKIENVPSAQPEPLTDKEQRIFLAAMGREEKVCEEVDRNYVREPYEDSLVRVCKEIRRKVKGALWI